MTLKNAIRRKQLAHAYLFCGPRGVGKTTCARIFAKTINCQHPSDTLEACGECESCRSFAEGRSYAIHELDAASNNSVDDIRNLADQVRVPPQIGLYSVYIIDEVHMLSPAAFNAFLKTLEEPPAHALFILATTEKHKIIPTILSRCQIYDFNRISIDGMVRYLKEIAEKEKVAVDDAALNIIAQKADGAMRDALSLFDQAVAFCGPSISYGAIIKNLHVVDYKYYFSLTDHCLAHRYADALLLFDEVLSKGFDALHFVAGLSEHFRNLLVCKDAATVKLFESGEAFKKDYLTQTTKCEASFLFAALGITNACEMTYKSSSNPRLHVELALLRLSNIGGERRSTVAQPATPASSTPATAALPPTPVSDAPPPPVSISLKDTLTPKAKVAAAAPPPPAASQADFTPAQLQAAWQRYIASIGHRQRMVAMLENLTPQLEDRYTVHITLPHDSLQRLIEEESKAEMLDFLRRELHNSRLSLSLSVAPSEAEESTELLYSPMQQLNYLNAHYPAVEKLKQELELDIK
jgi:DNA polymerase-3 subunit gamma/tau